MEELVSLSREREQFIKDYVPNMAECGRIAYFYDIFIDPTRVRILSALSINSMCVGDICYILKINQSTVSHQLKLMRDACIVRASRVGRLIVYSICNSFVADVILMGMENIDKERRLAQEKNIG